MLRNMMRFKPNARLCRAFSGQALATKDQVFLGADTNQALGIGQFAIDFMAGKLGPGPSDAVLERVEMFHTDSVVCGLSALALETNAPNILRDEAQEYPDEKGATCFASPNRVKPEKAIVANSNAVREWDSNGTVFGYSDRLGSKFQAGEFGHNDFYPVSVAAGQMLGLDGATVLRSCVLSDEIRGRLAEVFSLKSYKIDHVVHGAIASAATYGALHGATAEQIEAAIGMVVAHYIPFRAIRAGHQLSDSKGASAAISTEAAIISMQRAMKGFLGPRDIFRNPQSIFRLNEPTNGDSPFDLVMSHSGDEFAVMGMHFKLGLYEHQSAGAIQALIDAMRKFPSIATSVDSIEEISVEIYEPAFGIIGDPAKWNPTTRQSADHSMVYILSSVLRRAIELGPDAISRMSNDEMFCATMLTPMDYSLGNLTNPANRALMQKIKFVHGGPEYDAKYPDGIPTTVTVKGGGNSYSSGLVMYPSGHARNTTADLKAILNHKNNLLGGLAVEDVPGMLSKLKNLGSKSAADIQDIYNYTLKPNTCGERFI